MPILQEKAGRPVNFANLYPTPFLIFTYIMVQELTGYPPFSRSIAPGGIDRFHQGIYGPGVRKFFAILCVFEHTP